jgi:hypothetical protein
MANHKSSEKRNRQIKTKNESNKYHAKTMRNALKSIRSTTSKEEAGTMLPKINWPKRTLFTRKRLQTSNLLSRNMLAA